MNVSSDQYSSSRTMEVHSGYLTVYIKKGPHKTKDTFNNCWCVLFNGSKDVVPRIDIYTDDKKNNFKKSIHIDNMSWAKSEPGLPAFCFASKEKHYVFVTKSGIDQELWIKFLCCLSTDLFKSRQRDDDDFSGEYGMVVMQNVLYASSDDVDTFDVVAHTRGKCYSCGFKGLLRLTFDSKSIKLFDHNSTRQLVEWRYHSIRSYGCSRYFFNIKMGKKSSTGEGEFSYLTTEGLAINDVINHRTKLLKEKERESGGSLEEGNPLGATPNSISNLSLPPVKTKPAPPIPSPTPVSIATNSRNNGFERSLSNPSQHRESQEVIRSGSNKSSKEIMSKNDKKAQKEKEKKEKQLKKDQEKQEKKKQKELDKENKKAKKGKNKPHSLKQSSMEPVESVYAEPADFSPPISFDRQDLGEDYAVCGYELRQTHAIAEREDSKVYDAPWNSRHIPHNSEYENSGGDDSVYTSPKKVLGIKSIQQVQDQNEEYEDVTSSLNPPPIPPQPNWNGIVENNSNNDDVYDHFSVNPTNQQFENVYGIESANSLE